MKSDPCLEARFVHVLWDHAEAAAKRTTEPQAPPDALEWYTSVRLAASTLEAADDPNRAILGAAVEAANAMGRSLGKRLFDGNMSVLTSSPMLEPDGSFTVDIEWRHHEHGQPKRSDALNRIRAAAARLPRLYDVPGDVSHDESWWSGFEDDHDEGVTISDTPNKPGWYTDSGRRNYGLPEQVAHAIVEIVNAAKEL